MALSFDLADNSNFAAARIKVVGVGGGGGNAIRTMIDSQVSDVEFLIANTDIQALTSNPADVKIQLGAALTQGLGAGANPEVGRQSAEEAERTIEEQLAGADMVFITAGMGGGTGTGAAPVIAKVARKLGALTVGVVTRPFGFEGKKRARAAVAGLEELGSHVDALITIPNDKLLLLDPTLALEEAFHKADEVLVNAVQGISDLVQQNGVVNVDFADVKTVMSNMGLALMGIGYGRGDHRAIDAAQAAINSPLLDDLSVSGATGVLLNFMGGPDMRLAEVNEAASRIQQEAHEDANIIFGAVINPDMRDVIKVTVIATGFGRAEQSEPVQQKASRSINPAALVNQGRGTYLPPVMTQAPRQSAVEARAAVNGGSSVLPRQTLSPQSAQRTARAHDDDNNAWDIDVPTFLRNQRGA